MGIEWYDMIARKNGGYKNTAVFSIEGTSAEQIFEERLRKELSQSQSVLDADAGTVSLHSRCPNMRDLLSDSTFPLK